MAQRLGQSFKVSLVLALAAVFWLSGAEAQQSSRSGDVSDAIDVRVINVDVIVIDKKGNAVPGLLVEDFRVQEDGKDVTVDHFAFYQAAAADRPTVRRRSVRRPASEPGTAGSSTSSAGGSEADARAAVAPPPLTVALYLDTRNTYPPHRERIRTDLEQYLARADESTRWVLASFKDRLEILAGPSADSVNLLAALPSDHGKGTKGVLSKTDERQTFSRIADSYQTCETIPGCEPCISNWEEMVSLARTHAVSEKGRAAVAMTGIADLVGALSGIEGKKSVLYVGDGFHQRAGMATFGYLADLCEGIRPQAQNEVFRLVLEYDSTTQMQQVAAYANSNRVTLNMLDAGGVHAGQRSSVAFASAKFAPTVDNDRLRTENVQNTHFVLSNETGGSAILNANRPLEALVDLDHQLVAGSYSLGFVPSHPASGREHRLKVELVGKASKGRRLQYRRSYQDKKLEARLVDRLISGLFFEAESNPLNISVSVLDAIHVTKKIYEVPVEVTLDRSAFLSLPSPGTTDGVGAREPGRARIWLRAVSDEGGRSSVRQTFLEIVPPSGQDAGPEQVVVNMRVEGGGSYDIAVGVRDEVSREIAIVKTRAEVPVS